MTTIKLSTELWDRINRGAKECGLSAAELIENLLDAYECNRRMELFGKAARSADAEYWDEFKSWDLALPEVSNDA